MGFFRRSPATAMQQAGLPADFGATLHRFGRASLVMDSDPQGRMLVGAFIVDLWHLCQRDRDLFYRALAEAAAPIGGWAWVGAARVVSEVGPGGFVADPGYDALMERSSAFLRARNIPPGPNLTGFESNWWYSKHSGERWLNPVPIADPARVRVRPLLAGNERLVLRFAPYDNHLLVVANLDGSYSTLMEKVRSNEDPTRVRGEVGGGFLGRTEPTLELLYAWIGGRQQSPPAWVEPELLQFFPLPAPDFS